MDYSKLTIGKTAPEIINVVIEIPRGSHNKFEYDEELEVIKLDRVLHSPHFYPFDYGFAPGTRSEDGDHLDVAVLTTDPLFPGCLVEVRPVAVLGMIDGGEEDSKILGVADKDPAYKHVNTLSDITEHVKKNIEYFMARYKDLENKTVETKDWQDKEVAFEIIKKAIDNYQQNG